MRINRAQTPAFDAKKFNYPLQFYTSQVCKIMHYLEYGYHNHTHYILYHIVILHSVMRCQF